jgi:hypothetical protein
MSASAQQTILSVYPGNPRIIADIMDGYISYLDVYQRLCIELSVKKATETLDNLMLSAVNKMNLPYSICLETIIYYEGVTYTFSYVSDEDIFVRYVCAKSNGICVTINTALMEATLLSEWLDYTVRSRDSCIDIPCEVMEKAMAMEQRCFRRSNTRT